MNHQSDQNQSGFTSGLFFGLIIGGALGYFLQTELGQEWLQKFKQTTSEQLSFDDNKVSHKLQQAKSLLNKLESQLTPHHQTKSSTRVFRKDGEPLKPNL